MIAVLTMALLGGTGLLASTAWSPTSIGLVGPASADDDGADDDEADDDDGGQVPAGGVAAGRGGLADDDDGAGDDDGGVAGDDGADDDDGGQVPAASGASAGGDDGAGDDDGAGEDDGGQVPVGGVQTGRGGAATLTGEQSGGDESGGHGRRGDHGGAAGGARARWPDSRAAGAGPPGWGGGLTVPGFGVGGRRGSSRPAAAAAPAAALLAAVVGVVACGGGGADETSERRATGSSPVEAPSSEPAPPTSAPTDPAASASTTPGPATTAPAPPEAAPAPAPAGAEAADPVRVVIPAIGVDAPVNPLGLQASGALEVPTDFAQTGWWRDGPEPGEVGPAVIAGHVDSTRGPAVFYRLRELRPGDAVEVVGADGSRVGFVVGRVERHPKDAFPTASVYGDTAGPELRLVTCGGVFDRATGHYVDNVIAFATPA